MRSTSAIRSPATTSTAIAAVNKRLREQVGLKRMFLHASTLEFALDGGKAPYLLNAPLAPELIDVLDRLA